MADTDFNKLIDELSEDEQRKFNRTIDELKAQYHDKLEALEANMPPNPTLEQQLEFNRTRQELDANATKEVEEVTAMALEAILNVTLGAMVGGLDAMVNETIGGLDTLIDETFGNDTSEGSLSKMIDKEVNITISYTHLFYLVIPILILVGSGRFYRFKNNLKDKWLADKFWPNVLVLIPGISMRLKQIQSLLEVKDNYKILEEFKVSYVGECNINAVSGAIIAQLGITAFSFDDISKPPPDETTPRVSLVIARTLFAISIFSGGLCVFIACYMLSLMSSLQNATELRQWLNCESRPDDEDTAPLEAHVSSWKETKGYSHKHDSAPPPGWFDEAATLAARSLDSMRERRSRVSKAALWLLSSPSIMFSVSILTFYYGFSVYLYEVQVGSAELNTSPPFLSYLVFQILASLALFTAPLVWNFFIARKNAIPERKRKLEQVAEGLLDAKRAMIHSQPTTYQVSYPASKPFQVPTKGGYVRISTQPLDAPTDTSYITTRHSNTSKDLSSAIEDTLQALAEIGGDRAVFDRQLGEINKAQKSLVKRSGAGNGSFPKTSSQALALPSTRMMPPGEGVGAQTDATTTQAMQASLGASLREAMKAYQACTQANLDVMESFEKMLAAIEKQN
ncbi:hypothetical protein BJ508DRAFT_12223 [Ascobolus immersus RN42]|uniref:Uncharacterized protein n=1 Tax=Ascobolus immersus RN42 TaxID=1160509 RepID=A0A3N4HVI3_ASCIM|nr:hypothetical protein BJ508DRAFT_12223 [Ascobolus immersus RN42]